MGPPFNPWHLGEWSIEELHALFQEYGFKPGFWGYSIHNNEDLIKATSLCIGGCLNGYGTEGTRDLKAVVVISIFDEINIVVQSIRHYLKKGLHVHVIDREK